MCTNPSQWINKLSDRDQVGVASTLSVNSNLDVSGDIYLGGNLFTTSTGSPEIISAGDLLLTAGNRVSITSSVLRLVTLTTTERDLISAINGDIIYNTTSNRFQGYQNGVWINLDDGSAA
jgi:hypothetical protein